MCIACRFIWLTNGGKVWGDYVGSLACCLELRTISNCYVGGGSVAGTGWDVGGLVGENYEGEVTGSFWDSQTSGQATSGGGPGKMTDDANPGHFY